MRNAFEERSFSLLIFFLVPNFGSQGIATNDFLKNDLDGKEISQGDYDHAVKVWDVFGCQTFKDYLHVYLLCDVLHLADIFERYRYQCISDYGLDPAHYFSGPHFCYDAFLLSSNVELDLLTDVNQYFFLQKGIRGGLSMVTKRYSKAKILWHAFPHVKFLCDESSRNGRVVNCAVLLQVRILG